MNYKTRRFIGAIKHFPYNTMQGIKNIITWFPIIWYDKQWDYSNLFDIMLKKLELMEDFYNSDDSMRADNKETALDINTARLALKYIADDKHNEDAFKEWIDIYCKDECYQLKEEKESFNNALELEEKLYNEHMDIFCDIFKNKVLGWWD